MISCKPFVLWPLVIRSRSRACVAAASLAISLIVALLAPKPASAQCGNWLLSPLDDGTRMPATDGWIEVMIEWDPDGAGPSPAHLVAGGTFTNIEGVPASRIAIRDPRTGRWQPLGSGMAGYKVGCLTVYRGELIAAGSFPEAGGVGVNNIAAWNGSSWRPLGQGFEYSSVFALAVHNGALIAARAANPMDGGVVSRWNGSSWSQIGETEIGFTGRRVFSLAIHNGALIAGGGFRFMNGRTCDGIARWNGTTWEPLGAGLALGPFEYVASLISHAGLLYAGGSFTRGVAIWDGVAWQTDDVLLYVSSLAIHEGQLVAAGSPGAPGAKSVARFTGSSWQWLGERPNYPGLALAVHDGRLFVGGSFDSIGTTPAVNIAQWNSTEWLPLSGTSVGHVRAFTQFRSRLVAGGEFHQLDRRGVVTHQIMSWDGAGLTALGAGLDNSVYALESFKYPGLLGDYELIAGGLFTTAGGTPANHIARWREDPFGGPPPTWQAMGAGFDNTVNAIKRFNGATYAAGSFGYSTSPVSRIARWNETTDVWEPVGSGIDGTVHALEVYNGELYAGGEFSVAGGRVTGGLARWNGSTWNDVGGYILGYVYALEVHNGELVIAGAHPGEFVSTNLSRFNGTSRTSLGTGGTNGAVRALQSSGGRLYAGGDFTTAGGVPALHVAAWDGAAWSALPGGTDLGVWALDAYHDEIQVGGYFREICDGAVHSPVWARYSATASPWIAYQPSSQTVAPGGTTSFSVEPANGYGGLAYQWYKDGVALSDVTAPPGATQSISSMRSGSTTPMLTLQYVNGTDAGNYTVVITGGAAPVTSSAATLTLSSPADVALEPSHTSVEPIVPNPTRGPASLGFTLSRAAQARTRVYDVAGRIMYEHDHGTLSAGRHESILEGRGTNGVMLSPGLYVVEVTADGRRLGGRLLVVMR